MFHRSAKLAYRLGVGLNFGIDSDDSELTADNSFTRVRDTETTSNQFGLSINATRLKYFTPKKRMSFYWGAGPEVGFRFSDRDVNTNSTFEDSSMGISESSTQSIALNIGGILVFGTEFFLHKMISLTAEYRSRSAYTWTSEERDQIDTSSSGDVVNQNTSTTKHQVFIGSSSVLLGLSAYF